MCVRCLICVFQVWKQFDADCSGFIEGNELKSFIRKLLELSKTGCTVSEDDLIGYTDTMVTGYNTSVMTSFLLLLVITPSLFE